MRGEASRADGEATPAGDDLLERAAALVRRHAPSGGEAEGALARSRHEARAAVAAAGGGPEAAASAALLLVARGLVSLALERDWRREEVESVVAELGRLLGRPADVVALDLFVRAAADPRLLELPPPLALETALRLLAAFRAVDDASVWVAAAEEPPRRLADLRGREPTRRVRLAAREALASAEPAARPPGAARICAFPIVRFGRAEGALVVHSAAAGREATFAFAAQLAVHLSPPIERQRLLERSAERERKLLEAAERRLTRLAYDLHDGPVQDVLALGAELRLFREQLRGELGGHERSRLVLGRVDDLEARLVALDRELREVARSLETPTVLRTPLPDLIRQEAEELRERVGVEVDVRLHGNFDLLTPSQAIVLLRVVQEGLANVATHARARAATVTVRAGRDELSAVVTDDGVGFDVESTLVGAARRGRLGLVGMSERVRLLGGRFDVESRSGGPTTVAAVIPRWRPAD
jgi:signal transduction histidine kinase